MTYQKATPSVTPSRVERCGWHHKAPPVHCPLSACSGDVHWGADRTPPLGSAFSRLAVTGAQHKGPGQLAEGEEGDKTSDVPVSSFG